LPKLVTLSGSTKESVKLFLNVNVSRNFENDFKFLTSHAVIVSAPHLAAIIDNKPVPVPMSRTLASSPA